MSVRTITAKQMRNAYEYMVSHARTQINLERLSGLIETADVWDQNGRRDCFVTGDLSVEVKKVPDKDMRGLFHEAKNVLSSAFPEQTAIVYEAYVRLCMFNDIAMSALGDIRDDCAHPKLCAIAALDAMEKDARDFPRPFGWKFGKGFFKKEPS